MCKKNGKMKSRFLITSIALFVGISIVHAQQFKSVSSTEVNTLIKNDLKWKILDVRTADEFNSGHIKGAINIDITQENAFSVIDKLDHNGKYIVHCHNNRRSKLAVDHMVHNGFKMVYQMSDGISGWKDHHLPLVK